MKIEADEMWTFVGKKAIKMLWLTLHTDSPQIIAFHVGNRGDESAPELWQKVPTAIKKCLPGL
jgi:insertion element IS1 protein InsB